MALFARVLPTRVAVGGFAPSAAPSFGASLLAVGPRRGGGGPGARGGGAGLFVMLAFLAIAGRLFYLQVVEGDTFYRLTSDSIIRTDVLPALRGQIRDRKGRVLATVRPSYNVYVTPRLLTSETFARLRTVL